MYDGSANNVKVYVNGAMTQNLSNMPIRTSDFSDVWIGRDLREYTYNVQYGGFIYNIRIYDTALTQQQVIYNSQVDGTYGT